MIDVDDLLALVLPATGTDTMRDVRSSAFRANTELRQMKTLLEALRLR